MTADRRTRAARAALVLLLLALPTSACGSKKAASAAPPPCQQLPEGIGPDAAGTLQVEQNGGTFCLARGAVLTVFLKGSPDDPSAKWSAITNSRTAVLQPRSTGVMTLVRGVTAGIYAGGEAGSSELRSSRSTCPAGELCTWKATVVVTAG